MNDMMVEGYRVVVERQPEGGFIASVPDLPGCSIQVGSEGSIKKEITKAIGSYLLELASKKLKQKAPHKSEKTPPAPERRRK
ncbi:MAG: type II toxin-antitoxin system HicB family antitoxin [Candidatus Micrarchaeia archaeon]